MCFSASASFATALVLGLQAAGLLRGSLSAPSGSPQRGYFPLLFIPLLFGVQQASEGVVWLNLPSTELSQPSMPLVVASYVFVFFAYVFWPFFVPLAFLLAERRGFAEKKGATGSVNTPVRRWLLFALAVFGALLSLFFGSFAGRVDPTAVRSVGGHIAYLPHDTDLPSPALLKVVYVVTIFVPPLISSLKGAWAFGVSNAVFALYAITQYRIEEYTSVWCFFALVGNQLLLNALIPHGSSLLHADTKHE
jgi:hypothetical protein